MTPDYRSIWLGNASTNLADGVTFVAIPLLAAALTQDPLAIAGLTVAYTAPRILTVLGVGVLVDRSDRRQLLQVANLCRALVFAVLTGLVVLNAAPLPVLYAVVATMGIVETVSDTSVFAVLPQAVPRDRLDRANSQVAGTQLVADEFVGPPLGGFLFGLAGAAPAALTSLAYLVAGVSFSRLRGDYARARSDGSRPSVPADVREGASWAWHQPLLRALMVIGTIASVAYMIPFSYLVLYADQVLDLDATGYGVLLSVSALGGLTGTWVAGTLRRRLGYGRAILAALSLGSGSFLVVWSSTDVVVVAVALASYITHASLWNILATSVRQQVTSPELMGRVASVSRLSGLLGLALGAVLGGWLAATFGLRLPFLVAAVLFAGAAGICALAMPRFSAWETGR